jgi:hypothetical protein
MEPPVPAGKHERLADSVPNGPVEVLTSGLRNGGQMTTTQELLSSIVDDFEVLYQAYKKAGLLAEGADTEAAKKMLGDGDGVYRFKRQFLLADALIRNRLGRQVHAGGPLRHVAVFGGNNVGKSTVANILAAEKLASTSLEGGHTRHAQAFMAPSETSGGNALWGNNPHCFFRFRAVKIASLDSQRLDQFGEGCRTSRALPAGIVLWDMPDCDATASRSYMEAVVEAVAMADLVVYVTSVERYAVEHLVEWVFRLHEAGVEFVECLNRTRRADRPIVIENQRAQHFPRAAKTLGLPAPEPDIVGLRYLADGDEEDLWGPSHAEAAQLRDTVLEKLSKTDRVRAARQGLRFVLHHLNEVLEPAHMEAMAKEEWSNQVESGVKKFAQVYETEYLQSEKVIEPFSRLNLEILNLLDPNIPYLKETMRWLRWMTRWPTRLIVVAGRHVWKVWDEASKSPDEAKEEALPPELKAYKDAHEFVLNDLASAIDRYTDDPRHHPFWDALNAAWKAEVKPLSEHFGELVKQHMAETDGAIKQAAKEIYDELAKQPVLLNVLRTVKVSAGVTGTLVGFVLPHGGIVLDLFEDAVLPAVLVSGVEAATIGAVESFVSSRKSKLIEQLETNARTTAAQLYREPLARMANLAMQKTATLGIERDLTDRLPRLLEQLQAQLFTTGTTPIEVEDEHGATPVP